MQNWDDLKQFREGEHRKQLVYLSEKPSVKASVKDDELEYTDLDTLKILRKLAPLPYINFGLWCLQNKSVIGNFIEDQVQADEKQFRKMYAC